jgi:hypothetical protein
VTAPARHLQPAGARATAIAHTRAAVEAEARAASEAQPDSPGRHRLEMFKSALGLMEKAHSLAKASDPGAEEASGVSKALSEAEVEEIVYDTYARMTGVRT